MCTPKVTAAAAPARPPLPKPPTLADCGPSSPQGQRHALGMSSAKQAKQAKQHAKTASAAGAPTLGNLHKTCYPALKQIGRELIKLESLVSYDRGDMLRDVSPLAACPALHFGQP